jgi:hypothetical protein
MAHDEFPPLTHEAKCVLGQSINVSIPNWNRRFAAAVIREAMEQASPDRRGSCKWDRLGAIADNLHALSPPPPTREQMEEALQSLVGRIDFHPESQFAQEAAILAAGIAHHCKVQP